jgi:hypothetical protein
MVKDIIDTAINALDDFELKTFPERVIAIPTGNVSTLNFALSEADKKFLFDSGYTTAKASSRATRARPTDLVSLPQPGRRSMIAMPHLDPVASLG